MFGIGLSDREREQVIQYYERSLRVIARQGSASDAYNADLLQHMNSLDDSLESKDAMVESSRRLVEANRQMVQQHANLKPLPPAAGADYAAHALLYQDALAWSEAQYAVYLAFRAGRVPESDHVQTLFQQMETQRGRTDKESKKLLKKAKLTALDMQRLIAAATSTIDTGGQ